MTKVRIRDVALPNPINAVKNVGQKEIPVKCSREYAKFINVQDEENKALVIAHNQLKNRLTSLDADEKKEAERELEDYLNQEIDIQLLPHDLLSKITSAAPMDLVYIERLMEPAP